MMVLKESLQATLLSQLERMPSGRAIAFYGADRRFQWLSTEKLYEQSRSTAARLADRGLGRGDTCAIVLPSDERSPVIILAVLLLGAIPLLIAPPTLQKYNSDLLRILSRTLRKTRARLIVHDDSLATFAADSSRSGRERFAPVEEIQGDGESASGLPEPVFPAATDVVAMQLTSGTTGFPRVCVWNHAGVLAALDGMATAMRLREEDVCFNWTPLYHDMGLVNNFLLCLTHGAPLVLLNPHDFVRKPQLWLQGLSDTEATVTWSPNFGFALATERIRDAHLEGVRLDGVRGFWNAAERIHLDTMQDFRRRFESYGVRPAALKTNFGCAENIGGATFSSVDGDPVVEHVDGQLLQRRRIARPLSDPEASPHAVAIVGVGRPHPAMQVKILSRSGTPLPDGRVGEIALDTPSAMVGFLRDAAETRRSLSGGLVRTGDLGYLRGEELFWVGRAKERINVRGKKLDPSDFEHALLDVPDLRKGCFAAFGTEDPRHGTERIVIVAEAREPLSRSVEEVAADIRKRAFAKLDVKVDDVVLVRAGTLAKTSSGKRRHNHFRRLYAEGGLGEFTIPSEAPRRSGRSAGEGA